MKKKYLVVFIVLFSNCLCYSQWVQLGQDIDGEAPFDVSGQSVGLSSDGRIVAIGAIGNDGNGDSSGHVRVFERISGGDWIQVGQDIDGETSGDQSGYSLSLSSLGTTVAIGASPSISCPI